MKNKDALNYLLPHLAYYLSIDVGELTSPTSLTQKNSIYMYGLMDSVRTLALKVGAKGNWKCFLDTYFYNDFIAYIKFMRLYVGEKIRSVGLSTYFEKACRLKHSKQDNSISIILDYTKNKLISQINNVLHDSVSDPQYSSVTTNNMILCYIKLNSCMEHISYKKTVRDFFSDCGFSDVEYNRFEQSRVNESVYYVGVQYK